MPDFCCDYKKDRKAGELYCSHANIPAQGLASGALLQSLKKHYYQPSHTTRLSVRTVFSGAQAFHTSDARVKLLPSRCLILNWGQQYESETEDEKTESMCFAFQAHLVNDVASLLNHSVKLDEVHPQFNFFEYPFENISILSILSRLKQHMDSGHFVDSLALDELAIDLLAQMVAQQKNTLNRINDLAFIKTTTKCKTIYGCSLCR